MVDDPQDQQDQNFNDDRGGGGGRPPMPGGGGGGGLIGAFLPMLLGSRGGRFILLIGLAFAAFYFFRGGCSQGGGGGILDNVSDLARGGFLDPRQFEKASIYEPLADDNSRNPLPESANLQRYAPQVGNQGKQGSCVAWSSAYGARTILENTRYGTDATPSSKPAFSPAFLYNQIGLEGCQGSYIIRAMEFMTKQGAVPYDQFPYSDRDCSRQPDQSLIRDAAQFKMRGFNRLTVGDRNDKIDIRAVKENLAAGAPVVIGMMVGQSFMQNMMGKDVWTPEPNDRSMMGFGGHAMCVVGYDDKKYGGAFLIMNSWGPEWGTNGFAWVRYPEFNYFVREAYGLEPMAKMGDAANMPLQCEVGLVQVAFDGKKTVPQGYVNLRKVGDDTYANTTTMKPGTRFKMEVRNSVECYVYIFGEETDGSAYTLFPYPRADDPTKTKYSPFCGITGARLFPHDKSMMPDSIGKKDRFAVVVSREELNWYELNRVTNTQGGAGLREKLNASLRNSGKMVRAQYSSTPKGNIQFTSNPAKNEVAVMYVEIDKG
jgi:hypothetical protein